MNYNQLKTLKQVIDKAIEFTTEQEVYDSAEVEVWDQEDNTQEI